MVCSAFDEPYVARARPLLGILRGELHTLAFAEQLEHCAPHRAAVEEMLDAAFVADESEALVDEQSRDCAVRHTQALRPDPQGSSSSGDSAGSGDRERGGALIKRAGRGVQLG
jgi:hypothetical protein